MIKSELIAHLMRSNKKIPDWDGPVFHPRDVAEILDIPERNVNLALQILNTLPAMGDSTFSHSDSLRCRVYGGEDGAEQVWHATVSGLDGLIRNYALDLHPTFRQWVNAQRPAPSVRRDVEDRVERLETAFTSWLDHITPNASDTPPSAEETLKTVTSMKNMITGHEVTAEELESAQQAKEQWIANLQSGDFKQANIVLLSLADKCRPKSEISYSIREAAQVIGCAEKTFVRWLLQQKIMYRNGQNNLAAYSPYLIQNLFTIVEVPYYVGEGDVRVSCRTRFTKEGIKWLKDQAWRPH